MRKCGKVKNPCKICFETVTNKNGLRCQGACKKWVHYKCLNYTPGKIQDLKAGLIKISCPCPDCDSGNKEVIVKEPGYICNKPRCPAKLPPECDVPQCQKKNPIPSGILIQTECQPRHCPENCDEPLQLEFLPLPPCPPPPCPPPSCAQIKGTQFSSPCKKSQTRLKKPVKDCSNTDCSPPACLTPKKCCTPPSTPPTPKGCSSPRSCLPSPSCTPPICPPPKCLPPKCPPPKCLPPKCTLPKIIPRRFVRCSQDSCNDVCTKSSCKHSVLSIPERVCAPAKSYSSSCISMESKCSGTSRRSSISESNMKTPEATRQMLLCAMEQMYNTVGNFSNQFRELMCKMIEALEKC